MFSLPMADRIADSPKPNIIYWTAYSPPEGNSQPSDPLRFDMYAQRLGNLMLPGITNRTERLRYLSMVCAGIATTAPVGVASLREQRQALLPFERGWALAQALSVAGELKSRDDSQRSPSLKPEFRGLRGANRVLAHYRTLGDSATVHPNRYVLLKSQDAQGGLGAYLVTLRQFKFVQDGSLDLTALGSELSAAFQPTRRGRRLSILAASTPAKRSALAALGEDLCLGFPSATERRLVGEAIFGDVRQPVADCVSRMRAARPGSEDPRDLLEAIARPDGDELGRAAHFACEFDPLRIAVLQVFARLGRGVMGQPGPVSLGAAGSPSLEAAADSARKQAARLVACRTPAGLEPISELAGELVDGSSLADTVRSTLGFHLREGRAWIVPGAGDRYSIGKHGPFEDPAHSFNGYTVGRAMQLFDDTAAVS